MAYTKALIITPFYAPNVGGVETFCKELYTELSRVFDAKVITINWKKQKIWKGLPFWESVTILPVLFFKAYGNRADIIYAQGFNGAVVGMLLKWLWGCKLTITTHAIYNFNGLLGKVARFILNQADEVFTEGKLCEDNLRKIGVNSIIQQYMHWVDQERFKPIKKNNTHLIVMFAGRPIPEKGIEIIRQVEKLTPEVEYVYATNIPSQEMPFYYQTADILVVPSLYDESFARVVLEGASCGCVVIASKKGSLPELVSPFGIVTEPTVGNFYKEICQLNSDRKKLADMRENAIRYAKEHFSSKNAEVFF